MALACDLILGMSVLLLIRGRQDIHDYNPYRAFRSAVISASAAYIITFLGLINAQVYADAEAPVLSMAKMLISVVVALTITVYAVCCAVLWFFIRHDTIQWWDELAMVFQSICDDIAHAKRDPESFIYHVHPDILQQLEDHVAWAADSISHRQHPALAREMCALAWDYWHYARSLEDRN